MDKIKPMNLVESSVFTFFPMVMLLLSTLFFIPFISEHAEIPMVVSWYICGLIFVFLPMFISSILFYKNEQKENPLINFSERFRLNNFSLKIAGLSLIGTLVTFVLTYMILKAAGSIIPGYSAQPAFMHLAPLGPDEMWILAAWIPMFIFNIIGEAFYWRGYMFPRQEKRFGKYTWLVHGFCWLLFHIAFGINLLLTLIPIIFITSYLVQKTRSTWTDIIIHTFVNGTGFILVAFGVVS